jgi:hypothetical protein
MHEAPDGDGSWTASLFESRRDAPNSSFPATGSFDRYAWSECAIIDCTVNVKYRNVRTVQCLDEGEDDGRLSRELALFDATPSRYDARRRRSSCGIRRPRDE